jgi:thiol-disulfide isomerase/thioredoxin
MSTILKSLIALCVFSSTLQTVIADEKSDLAMEGERRVHMMADDLLGTKPNIGVLHTISDETIDVAKFTGNKPVYIKFWATWCVPCREQMPGFEKMYQDYKDKVEFIAVNTGFNDSKAAIKKFTKKIPMSMPIVMDDGSLKAILDVPVTPFHVLIDKEGKIAFVGHEDGAALHAALDKLAKQTDSASVSSVSDETKLSANSSVNASILQTINGQSVSLTGSNEHPSALVFFATWCESYLAESRPEMSETCKKNRVLIDQLIAQSKTSINWVGISSNLWTTVEDVQQYQTDTHTTLPIVFDKNGELFKEYGIQDVPTIVLLDKQGKSVDVLGPKTKQLEMRLKDFIAKEKD